MKNRAINGLVAILLGALFSGEIYLGVGLTIYGLWLAAKVIKEKKDEESKFRIIAIISLVLGYPLIVFLLISEYFILF